MFTQAIDRLNSIFIAKKEVIKSSEYRARWYHYFYACPDCGASVIDPVCPYCGETTNLYTAKWYKWLDKQDKKERKSSSDNYKQ